MLSSRRGHSIDVSDNIYGRLSGLSRRCFFKIVLQAFSQLGAVAVHELSGISIKIVKKNSVMKSRFINVPKRRI